MDDKVTTEKQYFMEKCEQDTDIENMLPHVRGTRLCRYAAKDDNVVAMCEQKLAEYTGARYALAVNSGTSAIYLALYAVGVRAGDEVLMPGLTFVSVPSAIIQMGAKPILVDITENYTIDINDLERKITPKTKALLITHMRSMIPDLRLLQDICKKHDIHLIEDCAHSMGAYFEGIHTGRFGSVGCFSTQSKLLNSGEGGFVITDSLDLMTKMILLSGCYGKNYVHHLIDQSLFEQYRFVLPCFSMRMSCLNAGYMRSFISGLEMKVKRYHRNFQEFYKVASNIKYLQLPQIHMNAQPCTNCILFRFTHLEKNQIEQIRTWLKNRGLVLEGYADSGNCRFYRNWKYIDNMETLEKADEVLENTFEFVLPSWFESSDVQYTADLLQEAVKTVAAQ